MPILAEHVAEYVASLEPAPDPLLAEMEALADRDRVPIVQWDTGRLLGALARALDPLVLEVGTAIGYSTLHIARELDRGRVVTIERDPGRAAQAREFLRRGGVGNRVQLIENDALSAIETLEGPFGMLFIDATKDESSDYLEAAEGLLTERALLVVDNLLMSGEVAGEPDGDTARWTRESLRAARKFNTFLAQSEQWAGTTLAVGDGVAVATRRL